MHLRAAILVLCLGACAPEPPPAQLILVAFTDFACPRNIDTNRYFVKAQLGIDYTICELEPRKDGVLAAEIRVGGHWALPSHARFAGFSQTAAGPIAWFHGVDEQGSVMLAFVPTGIQYHTSSIDVLLVMKGGSINEATAQRDELLRAVIQGATRADNSIARSELLPN